jgi:formamidopyrimidine-DNA glycosylase
VPELPEVEGYRSLAEQRALARPISGVEAPDLWYLKRGLDPDGITGALAGRQFQQARRRGKLLLLDVGPAIKPGSGENGEEPESVVGMHFGMSGRLIVDGMASLDRLLYSAGADGRHDRFTVRFADGGWLTVRDPRRLGGVELDPDESRLGPDALGVSARDLRRALEGSHTALKARLMDQAKLAGVGNLIADEVLWRAGLAPYRSCDSLTPAEMRRLHRHLSAGLDELIERGGSHMGDLEPHRHSGGLCPRDHTPLMRGTVGGRTTWWCPHHQR